MKGLLKVLLWLGIIGGIAALIGWAFLFEAHRAADNSMAPSLVRGDRFLVYVRSEPHRGAPILCEHPREPGRLVVGRVAGAGGDRVGIERGGVVVNGRALRTTAEREFVLVDDASGTPLTQSLQMIYEETGMNRYTVLLPERGRVRPMRTVTVPEGELFLLADNRATGEDSRSYGTVRESGCVGRPLVVYNPGPSSGDADRAGRWFDLVR